MSELPLRLATENSRFVELICLFFKMVVRQLEPALVIITIILALLEGLDLLRQLALQRH